jgi:glycosyltransferase involved in cell wall biosynthesis
MGSSSRPGLILGLATHSDSPGQRFRIHAWAPHLAMDGLRLLEVPFATPQLEALLPQPGHFAAKAWHTIRSAGLYRRRLSGIHDFDLLFVYREAMPLGPAVVERQMRRRGQAPMIYDIDDPLFVPSASGSNRIARRLRDPMKWRTLCGLADVTFCINEMIAEYVRPYANRVEVVPNAIDLTAYSGVREERDVPVLGYSGSYSTVHLLKEIEPALRRLARSHRFELRVAGGSADINIPEVPVRSVRWSADDERSILLGFDVGLAPAPDDEWNRYKSFVKVLIYMAAGLPVVASPVGLPARVIEHGRTGLFARTEDEWLAALQTLLSQPDLRARMGAAARLDVDQQFGFAQHMPRIRALFRGLIT